MELLLDITVWFQDTVESSKHLLVWTKGESNLSIAQERAFSLSTSCNIDRYDGGWAGFEMCIMQIA